MKSILVRGMFFLGAALLAAQEPAASEVIRNADGVPLRQPRILSFNGAVFQVEHAEGAIGIPWDRMPPGWRRGYVFVPPTAPPSKPSTANAVPVQGASPSATSQPSGQVVLSEPYQPSPAPSTPEPIPSAPADYSLDRLLGTNVRPPAEVPSGSENAPGSVVEAQVPLNSAVRLREHGGFDRELVVTAEDQGSINVTIYDLTKIRPSYPSNTPGKTSPALYSARHSLVGSWRPATTSTSLPRQAAFSNQRQLLYQDDSGAKVFFVESLGNKEGHVRLAIERGRGGPETVNANRTRPPMPPAADR